MGFIAFALWCGIRFAHNLSNEAAWLSGIAGALSFFYIGIYMPTTVIPLIAIWFFEVAVVSLLQKDRCKHGYSSVLPYLLYLALCSLS